MDGPHKKAYEKYRGKPEVQAYYKLYRLAKSKLASTKKRNAEYQKKYRKTEYGKAYWNKYHQDHKAERNEKRRVRNIATRYTVLSYYSDGIPYCKCCGESTYEFLTVDHINNDGSKHRREIGSRGDDICRWLIKNKFPSGFQILCMNCNFAKGKYKSCPHTKTLLKQIISK